MRSHWGAIGAIGDVSVWEPLGTGAIGDVSVWDILSIWDQILYRKTVLAPVFEIHIINLRKLENLKKEEISFISTKDKIS